GDRELVLLTLGTGALRIARARIFRPVRDGVGGKISLRLRGCVAYRHVGVGWECLLAVRWGAPWWVVHARTRWRCAIGPNANVGELRDHEGGRVIGSLEDAPLL